MGLVWRSPEDPNIVVVLDEPGPEGGYIDYNSLQGLWETFELNWQLFSCLPATIFIENDGEDTTFQLFAKYLTQRQVISLGRKSINCAI